MNQTATYTLFAAPAASSKLVKDASLLHKIVARLKSLARNHRQQVNPKFQHQSFIDSNLLDDFMGPEISRTLRR